MKIIISQTAEELGRRAAEDSARIIKEAIADHGCARIVLSV